MFTALKFPSARSSFWERYPAKALGSEEGRVMEGRMFEWEVRGKKLRFWGEFGVWGAAY